jgi:adenine phosphoribosyltransferase
MLERLKKSLEECPVVKKGDYDYFVHPITDGVPSMDPTLLREVLERISAICDFSCDYILAPEAMGIPLAVPLSLQTGIPYSVIRKRQYGLPGEVGLKQTTGYSKSDMFINGLSSGDRVVLVDDVVSTGGTLKAIIQTLRSMGVVIVDVIIVVEKGDAKVELERELDITIKTLVKVKMVNGKVQIIT